MVDIDLAVLDLARDMMMVVLIVAGPMLAVGLLVGLAVSLFQALTSIQEQTLAMVPKMFAVIGVALLLLAPTIALLRDYTLSLFERLASFGLS
jgi:flagellar biosynthesis protein FliQ